MEMLAAKMTDAALSYSSAKINTGSGSTRPGSTAVAGVKVDILSGPEPAVENKAVAAEAVEPSREQLDQVVEEMTGIMKLLNTDIKFELHEGSGRWIVQVVDTKENKVLKEYPPQKLLDTIAAIREYVGLLLDEKV
ncbi:flagellar protein FlaG [Acetonema longum]|uniref:Flagellar protein FlaG protein n=1 Tax=Acetonema longum DSM 6540 TaxID=1009370 RepID=F7NNW4_9FIRM|nr:flagellar protein FlaG [Acetonema longum]EGO62298.1 flagellar protein FlaG protein [Acetonema longum DSM 6540]